MVEISQSSILQPRTFIVAGFFNLVPFRGKRGVTFTSQGKLGVAIESAKGATCRDGVLVNIIRLGGGIKDVGQVCEVAQPC